MAKHKMVLQNLINNSSAAYYAAIEIHNKPNIAYRYETVTLLILNAWELILKAYIWRHIKPSRIFEKGNYTINLEKALNYVNDAVNSIKPGSFIAVKENILLVNKFRNNVVHYYDDQLVPAIFSLVARSAVNYVDFMKSYFSKDVTALENLYILPLGFMLPFHPADFLSQTAISSSSANESKEFIQNIVRVITDLKDQGVEDSIVIGFDVYLESVKKVQNSDILVAIASTDQTGIKFTKISKVRLSDDPNAQKVNLDDEGFRDYYPHPYHELLVWAKGNITGFKLNKFFHAIRKEVAANQEWVYIRRLDTKNTKSTSKIFYSDAGRDEIKRRYEADLVG